MKASNEWSWSWHLNVGFHIIEKLTSKPQPKVYRKLRKRKPTMVKPKKPSDNPLIKKDCIKSIKQNPNYGNNMSLLRNSILPVNQDFEKVLRWLNTITI